MAWKDHLQQAKLDLKASRLDDCLAHLNRALLVGGDREHTVYDCRAAVYECQGKLKSALKDVQNVITLAPAHWQGYARASRLFLRAGKLDQADKMADLALARLNATDTMRRAKLEEVKADVHARRRASVHHFGQLPVEIMTTIFEMVCASDWTRVLTLWRVSKHWYNIVVNTPKLWSILVLTNRHPARHAQRWIERSKGRIRELKFRSSLPSIVSLDGLAWDCLRICRLDHPSSAQYMREKLDRLSELEEFQVTFPALDCNPLLVHPGLRRVTLDGSQFSWDKLASSHGSLTSLEVRHPRTPPSFEEVILVLESNPLLEQLILEFESSRPLPSAPTPPSLTLSNLRTLHLAKSPWAPRFFQLVTMPALETLGLSTLRTVGLAPLIEKQLDLLHLSINCCSVSSADLLQLVAVSHALQTLKLVRLEGTNSVVEALASSSTLCPALTHLDVSHCPEMKTGPIVALLKSRNTGDGVGSAARLATIVADGCTQIEANLIPWIRAQVKTFSCIYMTKRAASWKR